MTRSSLSERERPASAGPASLQYQPHIDGLRAIAVLVVVLFHADLGIPGGFVGVDVFFVISGYLITSLMLKEQARGTFCLIGFWERRVRRIMPALTFMIMATLIVGWMVLLPDDFRELGQSAVAQSVLLANFYFFRETGYFAQASDLKPLLHTWSLAVEEQFYLLFPLLLLWLGRRSLRGLQVAIWLIGGGSFLLSVFCTHRHPQFGFYLLPTRAWELLLGALVAVNPIRSVITQALSECAAGTGLLAILWAAFNYDSQTPFPGAAALLPCVGAAFIILANQRATTLTGRLLVQPPLIFIGLISYSLYLWHWPVLVFAKYWAQESASVERRVLLLLGCLAIAWFSWRFIETPFRNRAVAPRRLPLFATGAGATLVMLAFGLIVHRLNGLPDRFSTAARQYASGVSDRAFVIDVTLEQARQGEFVELGTKNASDPIEVLVWGDSHAMSLLPIMDVLCKERSMRGVAAVHSLLPPLLDWESRWLFGPGESVAFNRATLEFIRTRRIPHVVLVGYWSYYLDAIHEPNRIRSGMMATLAALNESGARVWVVRQVPKQRVSVPKALALAEIEGRDLGQVGCSLVEHSLEAKRMDPIFEGLSRSNPRAFVLDPAKHMLGLNGRSLVAYDGRALYCDNHHLAVAGALFLRPLFEETVFATNKLHQSTD